MNRQDLPFVSVVMPVRNEAKYIERSLGAVLAQDYPADRMEVIVADGMSDDGTRELIEKLKLQVSPKEPFGQVPTRSVPSLKLIDNPGKIVSTGLNRAIEISRGEIIVRVDGHTIVEPDYVKQCVIALQRTGADNVGGRMNAIGVEGIARAIAVATSSPFGVGGARFHYSDKEEWVDTVYMGAWRREVFEHIGLFDEEQVRNQDDEFNYRLRECGGTILLSPEIKSEYYNRRSLISLWRQYVLYGYWKVRVVQKHPKQVKLRQFIPTFFVGSLMVTGVGSVFLPATTMLFMLTLTSYCTANLGASLATALRNNVRQFFLLPVCFATLHFSYGIGFLAGLFKFWNRWGMPGIVPSIQQRTVVTSET